ncbi:p21-activated protein kinase-interacting protein 1-like [Microplitis demolitor]|uniref:p21-activated protein kinase-interacting protein 1-like n=1 Tax=Microplitis demolitor TaxID=69319 RepID=UPI0004CCBE30|nr:p21-activated protein kinase-interacting protein 1-like [Microplitis demolitor]
MTEDFEIIVGTYEQFLLGYKIHKEEKKYKLERSFATKDHTASIRTVSSRKNYLASGAADDCINLYDMKSRTESGKLIHHNGTVNCVTFTPDATHLLSCSSDGNIGVVRCGNWQLEKNWTSAHKNSEVNTLAVHPTGKLALSVGTDGVLRTWNLVKGRQAYATNLVPRLKLNAKNITVLRWSPDGMKYLMAANNQLDAYTVENAGLCAEITLDSKIVCVEFISDNVIVIGQENGTLKIWDIEQVTELLSTIGHDARVKCLGHRGKYIVSASSSGEVKLWKYVKQKLKFLTKATCDARITCMTLI